METPSPPMTRGAELYARAFALGWQSHPEQTTSEWADERRWLAPGTSPDAGKWDTARTPYLREIMDVCSPQHPAKRIVIIKGSRMGGTEALNNLIGRTIDLDHRSICFYNPDITSRNDAKRERIDPMIEDSPALRKLVTSNSLLSVKYQGGRLTMLHASSIRQFRARGAPIILCDEIDAWIPIVCSEGDKIRLAEKRASNYPNPKIVLNSSPGERDVSPIEREFLRSDQRRFFLRCPACGEWDYLTWSGYRDHVRKLDAGHYWIEWDPGAPRTARAVCGHCETRIPETQKYLWLPEGRWRPTAEGDGETVGFHLPSLLAPLGWFSWADMAGEFLEAHDQPEELRTFVNTRLGETFEDRSSKLDAHALTERLEDYGAEVPDGVGVLLGAVDTHDDRLELLVVGFGAHEEAWVIAWQPFYGDPKLPGVWQQLEAARLSSWTHVSGQQVALECLTVDTMGHKTEGAYRYCKAREERNVFAIRGSNQLGLPVVGRPSNRNRYRVNLFPLCTDTAKARLFARLALERPGPGYVHLPKSLADPEEFVAQLTAEKAIWKHDKHGRPKREWYQLRPRNEALDLMVYALAALYIRGPKLIQSLGARAAKLSVRVPPGEAPPPRAPMPARRRSLVRPPRPNWATGWKR